MEWWVGVALLVGSCVTQCAVFLLARLVCGRALTREDVAKLVDAQLRSRLQAQIDTCLTCNGLGSAIWRNTDGHAVALRECPACAPLRRLLAG